MLYPQLNGLFTIHPHVATINAYSIQSHSHTNTHAHTESPPFSHTPRPVPNCEGETRKSGPSPILVFFNWTTGDVDEDTVSKQVKCQI